MRLHRFIREYLNFVGSAVIQNKDVLADKIAPFDGLYSVDDWFWSAPRPLPRAWIREGEVWTSAAMVFWDGSALITLTESELNPAQLQALLPDPLRSSEGRDPAIKPVPPSLESHGHLKHIKAATKNIGGINCAVLIDIDVVNLD